MGTRENAYFKYLRGDNTTLTERGIDPNDISQFQNVAQIAANNNGQMSYDKYPNGSYQVQHTIGRTAPGQIRRDGNTWIIQDDYNFNGADTSLWDKAKFMAKSFLEGKPLQALSRASTLIGDEYKTDIRVPLTPEQIVANGSKMAYDANNTVVGGQQYKWEPYQLQQGETFESVARNSFNDNKYKAEGINLNNYTRMLEKQNYGNHSNIIYRPVKAR